MDEQGVVGASGRLHHRERRGVGEGVGGADHEIVECVPRVERPARIVGLQDPALLRGILFLGRLGRDGAFRGLARAVHHESDDDVLHAGSRKGLADHRQIMLFQPVLIEAVGHGQGQLPRQIVPHGFDDPDPPVVDVGGNGGRKEFAGLRPDMFCLNRFHFKSYSCLGSPVSHGGPPGTIQISAAFFLPPRPVLDSAGRAFGPLIHSLFTAASLSSAPKTAPTVGRPPRCGKPLVPMKLKIGEGLQDIDCVTPS